MKEAVLCRLDDIADGGSAAFAASIGGARTGVMALRRDGAVFVYVNSCPHMGRPSISNRGASSTSSAPTCCAPTTAPCSTSRTAIACEARALEKACNRWRRG